MLLQACVCKLLLSDIEFDNRNVGIRFEVQRGRGKLTVHLTIDILNIIRTQNGKHNFTHVESFKIQQCVFFHFTCLDDWRVTLKILILALVAKLSTTKERLFSLVDRNQQLFPLTCACQRKKKKRKKKNSQPCSQIADFVVLGNGNPGVSLIQRGH